jgi:hypothetical protein
MNPQACSPGLLPLQATSHLLQVSLEQDRRVGAGSQVLGHCQPQQGQAIAQVVISDVRHSLVEGVAFGRIQVEDVAASR